LLTLRRCGWRSQLTADREVLDSHLAVVWARELLRNVRGGGLIGEPPLDPARCGYAPRAAVGFDLQEALERVARDAETDHTARSVDVFDRVGRNDAAPASEKAGADGQSIRDVRRRAVHRAFDSANNPALAICDEKSVQHPQIGSGDGHVPTVALASKRKLCRL
jgi:hypothetical protein